MESVWLSHTLMMMMMVTIINIIVGNSLAVQWLGLCTFTAKRPGSILGQGTKIPQVVWRGQKIFKNKIK